MSKSGVDARYNHPGKVYVEVKALFDTEGIIVPLSFKWEDGKEYEIDKVLHWERVASLKAGGTGMRYTVRVQGRETHLWLEVDRWFMERR